MSRTGYDEDCWGWDLIRYRGQVASATRGKRGQEFFKELVEALDALPEKKLIAHELQAEGSYCALGSLGAKRGIDMSNLDPQDADRLAEVFGVAHQLIREVEFMNDEAWYGLTPEDRWRRVREWAGSRILKQPYVRKSKKKGGTTECTDFASLAGMSWQCAGLKRCSSGHTTPRRRSTGSSFAGGTTGQKI